MPACGKKPKTRRTAVSWHSQVASHAPVRRPLPPAASCQALGWSAAFSRRTRRKCLPRRDFPNSPTSSMSPTSPTQAHRAAVISPRPPPLFKDNNTNNAAFGMATRSTTMNGRQKAAAKRRFAAIGHCCVTNDYVLASRTLLVFENVTKGLAVSGDWENSGLSPEKNTNDGFQATAVDPTRERSV